MSRAVIDQAGFKVCTVGLIISLVFGLALKSQISPRRVGLVLQDAVSRLEKDFIIDFKSAEVKLSKWGLPLPFLEIAQLRLSPKKALCQDTQIYIESLSVPLSLVALFTSRTLVSDLSASNVELRIAEVNNCLATEIKNGTRQESLNALGANYVTESQRQTDASSKKNIFQIRTAAQLNKIKIDQLKIIFKNYPTQALDLRQAQFDLSYSGNQLDKIQLSSQIYALKDPQSSLHYFRGKLALVATSLRNNTVELEAKLEGRLLDGELQIYAVYNTLEQNLKTDFSAKNIALKPFIQLNLIESSWLNYPVGLSFQGFSLHQFDGRLLDGSSPAQVNLKSLQISGNETFITAPEIRILKTGNKTQLDPFTADIQKLDLNKLKNLHQLRGIEDSIENFGNFQGTLAFKDFEHIKLSGTWANLEFIFSNRGRRELQKLDQFKVDGGLASDAVVIKFSDFVMNTNRLLGKAEFLYNTKTQTTSAEAQLSGTLLNERIWSLLTQVPQAPDLKFQWNYRKSEDERHQIYFYADAIKTHGLKFTAPEFQMIQSFANSASSALAVTLKAKEAGFEAESMKAEALTQIFNSESVLSERFYTAENFNLNLKGTDWKNMSFELETKMAPLGDTKKFQALKSKGEWKEDESLSASLTVQQFNGMKRFEIVKKVNSSLSIQPL